MQSLRVPRKSSLLLLLSAWGSAGCVVESPPAPEPLGRASSAQTVAQAATNSCGTSSVKGLSDQIIAQAACIEPDAFVKLPALPNVTINGGVLPYLEKPARDALVQIVNAHPNTHLGINSMLRSIAQQYLLYHWYQTGTCGIGLAAKPGNSNHESGLAFDTSDYGTWKSALTSGGFKWLGSSDPVHYDYVGAGAVDYRGTDVLAFQQLWNKNHPDDKIAEDGEWGPQTESKMAASPADGFPMPVVCEVAPPDTADMWLSADVGGATDAFADGASMGVPDTFEGEASTISFRLVNKGKAPATKVTIGLDLDSAYLEATDYLIESDWMNAGAFKENDANTLATNPPHTAPLASSVTLDLNQLSPGETKRVTLTIRAASYSVDHESPAGARVFVKEIPGAYTQASYGGEVTNASGQTFNGGRLEVAATEDVYSHARWEWNSNRLEGFTVAAGGTISATGTSLKATGGVVLSPAVDVEAGAALSLRASRSGGTGAAKVALLAKPGDDVSKAKTVALDLPADGEPHDVTVELDGAFAAFALLPFDGGSGTIEIDSAELGDPIGPSTGSTGEDANADVSGDLSGTCACSVVGARSAAATRVVALTVLGALALAARRRRHARA
ncbi:MAG: M15 family metallopeptidase [Polyangiaceae bacterium]